MKTFARILVSVVLVSTLCAGPALVADHVPGLVDAHAHLFPGGDNARGDADFAAQVQNAITSMDRYGIAATVIMPHPFTARQRGLYTEDDFIPALTRFPGRFVWYGGGGTLNPILQSNADPARVTDRLKAEFRSVAERIIARGARGFGELVALHFSMRDGHPFESVTPDHPLLLLLADIAAEKKVPLELHMEAVPEEMATPAGLGGANPDRLAANIPAIERLLAHNRNAVIVWSHVGWDNTGARTPALTRSLMEKNPNLWLNIKLGRDASGNPLLGPDRTLKADWLAVFEEFQDRIMFATDQFYAATGVTGSPERISASLACVKQLAGPVAAKIGYLNAKRLLKID